MARLLLLGAAGLLAACGSGTTGVRVSDDRPPDRFTITVAADQTGAETKTWTLTCRPTGGDHPNAAAACAALAETSDPFGPVPADVACTEIYDGPEVATIVGTSGGTSVNAHYTRTNGCEISRWDAIAAVFNLPA